MTQEQDLRLGILNTLLTTPHRDLAQIWPVHREMVVGDPRFYVRLAAWYFDHGDVRDHKEMFIVTLALSDYEGHRDVGLAMLRKLPPYEVLRVVDFIHGTKKTRKVRPVGAGHRRQCRGAAAPQGSAGEAAAVVEEFGLFRNLPRGLKTEVTRYLREREADPNWFDSTVLQARKDLKRLYALLHIKPGERAQQILFDDDPPADSRAYALRELARATDPTAQARAIVEHRIPYRVAATVVQRMTPAVLLALVDCMSPQEVINNIASLERRGAMDNPDLKALIEQKLDEARTDQRVSALKANEALKVAAVSAGLQSRLESVADAQVKAKGRISRPVALLVDKSASMSLAIDLGKRIAALISAVCERELYVYAFDTLAFPIARAGDDLASWDKTFRGITAAGGTSCGVPLDVMTRKSQYVEQIILITDEEENTEPLFVPTFKRYREQLKVDPDVCIVRTPGASSQLEQQCRAAGIVVDVFQFSGDYYSLPNLVPLLARSSKLELLLEVLDYPLLERQPA